MKIEISDKVYELLQEHAVPFADTPNAVLERFLFPHKGKSSTTEPVNRKGKSGTFTSQEIPPGSQPAKERGLANSTARAKLFLNQVLEKEFGGEFSRNSRFTYMFENDNAIVYFQNCHKSDNRAWYRISESARDEMERKTEKKSFICLTIPGDQEYYFIPYPDILERLAEIRWERKSIEANINRVEDYWTDLRWRIGDYSKRL